MALSKTDICNLALSKIGNERLQLTNQTFDLNTGATYKQCSLHYTPTLHELCRMHSWNVTKRRYQFGAKEIKITIPATQADSGVAEEYTVISTSVDSNGKPTYSNNSSGQTGYINLSYSTTSDVWELTYGSVDKTYTLTSDSWSPNGTYTNNVVITLVKPKFEFDYSYSVPEDTLRVLYVTDTADVYQYAKPIIEWQFERRAILTNCDKLFALIEEVPSVADMNNDPLFQQAFYTLLASKLAVPIAGDQTLFKNLYEEFATVIMPEARRVNGFEMNKYATNDSEWMEATFTSSSASNSYPPFAQTNYNVIP